MTTATAEPPTETKPADAEPPDDGPLKCQFIPDDEIETYEKATSADDASIEGLGCQNDAEFEILDAADPNPYTCLTHACTEHVGQLLGHDESVPAESEDRWMVRPV